MSDRIPTWALDPEGVADGNYALTVAGGHVTGLTAASSGSGGGTATAAWDQVVNLPLTTLTGWTVGLGTWSAAAGGIRQASTAAARQRLYLNQLLPMGNVLAELEVRIDALASSVDSRAGVLFGTPLTGDTLVSGGDLIALQANGSTAQVARVHEERDNAANGPDLALAAPIANGTWTTLRVFKTGVDFSVWVNGALLGSLRGVHNAQVMGRFGLVTDSADATFRNLKVWAPTHPDGSALAPGVIDGGTP